MRLRYLSPWSVFAVGTAACLAGALLVAQPARAQAGPDTRLPAGPGRESLIKVCSACHVPTVVARQRHDADGWTQVVGNMLERGARGTDDELEAIIDYLAATFPDPTAQGHSSSAAPASVRPAPGASE